jgi:type I site-specific restriction-modification system R (restriction) subunit
MRDALPKASFIGLSGTPIESGEGRGEEANGFRLNST